MYTIGRLAELFGLSRSALLFYERKGLLKASGRSAAAYRLYDEEDRKRLELVMLYRRVGVPLEKIRRYLDVPQDGVVPLLLGRLVAVNEQIDALKKQQEILLAMIESEGSLKGKKALLKKMKALGEAAGITEDNYGRIHGVFERVSPRAHRRFLAYLGFSKNEIAVLLKKIKA